MTQYPEKLPMKATRRLAQAPASKSNNCELIYSKTLGVLNSGKDDVIKTDELMSYELSPVPLALFDETTQS